MVEPISPKEVVKNKKFPDCVIEGFNQMIIEKWDGHSSTFTQDAVLNVIVELAKPDDVIYFRSELFNKHNMDVESLYKKKGWKVTYDKPAYNETFEATFKFEKKRRVVE